MTDLPKRRQVKGYDLAGIDLRDISEKGLVNRLAQDLSWWESTRCEALPMPGLRHALTLSGSLYQNQSFS